MQGKRSNAASAGLGLACLILFTDCAATFKAVPAEYSLPAPRGKALETIDPPGLVPAIGRWMVAPDGEAAKWLGQRADGKIIYEPVNVVIFDPYAKDAAEAEARLVAACKASGFDARDGHSSGYGGIIEGFVYPELPTGPGDAFSDQPFVFANNHGRIFGPHPMQEGWLFVGAFSREGIDLTKPIPHVYESMNRARDAFVAAMIRTGGWELAGFNDLGNAIVLDAETWTGDHDAVAPLLRATKITARSAPAVSR